MALILCPTCQEEISEFCGACPHCGTTIQPPQPPVSEATPTAENTTNAQADPAPKKKNIAFLKENGWQLAGMLISLIAVVVGFVIIAAASGTPESASFGADFYTYTYSGIRATVIAVRALTQAVGGGVSLFGAIAACRFGIQLKK